MASYLTRRLLQAVLVLLAVSLLSFGLIYLAGDPVRSLVPPDARPEDVENIRHGFGLDQPVYLQYVVFLQKTAQGDLGQSFKYRTSAMGLVLERLPQTLLLATTSIGLAVLIAIPLGILAATRRGGPLDFLASGLALLTISTPSFWLGMIVILVFADWLRVLPASGSGTPRQLILPALTLAAYSIGLVTRLVRATVTDILRQNYITTARGKGLTWAAVNYRHALRNGLIPTVTVLGLQFGALLGGSVVVESVFGWPGLGFLMVQAIGSRDIPLVRAIVLVISLFFVLINLAIDLFYTYLDPRIRYV
jgi:ABC-type dipeptide/oligopeptide/nickel transport system permease component